MQKYIVALQNHIYSKKCNRIIPSLKVKHEVILSFAKLLISDINKESLSLQNCFTKLNLFIVQQVEFKLNNENILYLCCVRNVLNV